MNATFATCISLAQYATVYTRSWAVDSMNGRVRLKAENKRLLQELALRDEEIRIKDARMAPLGCTASCIVTGMCGSTKYTGESRPSG